MNTVMGIFSARHHMMWEMNSGESGSFYNKNGRVWDRLIGEFDVLDVLYAQVNRTISHRLINLPVKRGCI